MIDFKIITKNTAIMYSALVFVGYMNLHFFYVLFDIPIYNYISLTEILTLFLPILAEFVLVAIPVAFILFISVRLERKKSKKSPDDKNNIDSVESNKLFEFGKIVLEHEGIRRIYLLFVEVLKALTFLFLAVMLMFFLLIPFIIFINYYTYLFPYRGGDDITIVYIIWGFPYLLGSLFLGGLIKRFNSKYDLNIKFGIAQVYYQFIFFTILIISIRVYEAESILKSKPFYNVSFRYDGEKVATDSSTVFLGQTHDYIFLRNLKSNKNIIYNRSQLRNFEITINKKLKEEDKEKNK